MNPLDQNIARNEYCSNLNFLLETLMAISRKLSFSFSDKIDFEVLYIKQVTYLHNNWYKYKSI